MRTSRISLSQKLRERSSAMHEAMVEDGTHAQWRPVKHDGRMLKLAEDFSPTGEIVYWRAVFEAAKHGGHCKAQLDSIERLIAAAVAKRFDGG